MRYQDAPPSVNTFPADWNGNLYSAIAWMKVDQAGRWNADTTFRYGWHVRDGADVTYYTVFGRHTDANTIFWRRRSGGAIAEILHTFVTPPTGWFCMGITHDQSAPVLNAYLWDSVGGFQTKTPNTEVAKLTDWGIHLPTAGTSIFGAGSLTLQEWIGSHSLAVTWAGSMLTGTEMQKAMTP